MRTATAVIMIALATIAAAEEKPSPYIGLFDGGSSLLEITKTNPMPSLVPNTVTQTGLDGVTLFNDRENNRYGSTIDIGNGMWLINTQGSQNSLTICQKDTFGNTICN